MNAPPGHIHPKPDAQPQPRCVLIPVPIYWQEAVTETLDKDVDCGIIAPMPVSSPMLSSKKEWLTKDCKLTKSQYTVSERHITPNPSSWQPVQYHL